MTDHRSTPIPLDETPGRNVQSQNLSVSCRRFVKDDALAANINQGVGRAQVDGQIGGDIPA